MSVREREAPQDRQLERARAMARAQEGDRDAYRRLLDDITVTLRGFLRRRLASVDDADDVLQTILLTVHRARHTYDPGRPFEPWLFAIARHALVDHARRAARMARVEVAGAELPEVAAPEPSAAGDRLRQALERLPATQREAFELLQLEGVSVAEAAARAGTTPGALKVRAHRAYRALRALLRGTGG